MWNIAAVLRMSPAPSELSGHFLLLLKIKTAFPLELQTYFLLSYQVYYYIEFLILFLKCKVSQYLQQCVIVRMEAHSAYQYRLLKASSVIIETTRYGQLASEIMEVQKIIP